MDIDNPLPQRCMTIDPGVGGTIKARAEDFLVDELPLYEPSGKGEHLYLGIQKTDVAHGELIACLRKTFKVNEAAIGFAGMKDKIGITRQMVSVHLPRDPGNAEIDHRRINVLWKTRHANKIRRGHLAGNRFSIRIRDVDPLKAPAAMRILRQLETNGVPNYFGSQRFGYRLNNHAIGAALLTGDWAGAVNRLLGATGGQFPEYQRERRELFDAGKFAEAAALWTAADRSERIICQAMARNEKPRKALIKVGHTAFSFWISALQSAIFNRVLDWRLEHGLLCSLIEGDVACKHSTTGMFHVTKDELAAGDLASRLAALEISVTGPLWGTGMMMPVAPVATGDAGGQESPAIVERAALDGAGVPIDAIMNGSRSPEGGRRSMRAIIRNIEVDSGMDDHGPFIRVAFDLPRGAYATVVMREIMKAGEAAVDEIPSE